MRTMANRTTYQLGPDVAEGEALSDSRGRLIDNVYAEEAAADALQRARGRGRPSLSQDGVSPMLRVRLPVDLDRAVRHAAERVGKSRAEWVRDVLDEAAHKSARGDMRRARKGRKVP